MALDWQPWHKYRRKLEDRLDGKAEDACNPFCTSQYAGCAVERVWDEVLIRLPNVNHVLERLARTVDTKEIFR